MKILLNMLGICIYFLSRFNKRRSKEKNFSIKFWITDNWPELLTILLVDISVMILFVTNDISFDMASFVPDWLVNIGDLGVSWLIGLGLAYLVYNVIRKKLAEKQP